MIMVAAERATLLSVVQDAQNERVIITRDGKPVAIVIGIEGLDEEQLQLGTSEKFWSLITQRRAQKTLNRAELEKKVRAATG